MPLNIIRRIVSGQKKRFQDGPDGFDLDLAYITPRIIAMGLPAVQGKEVLYRNPMPEIARFLQTYHRGHAKVYNLCSEHTYSAQHLAVALQQYPFDDHQTPPLALVQQFCTDAAAWLAADPANVVVVHCKAGKGRTGVMICCLLLYLHKNSPELANLSAAAAAAGSALHAAPRKSHPGAHSSTAEQQAVPVVNQFPPADAMRSELQHAASHAQHTQHSSSSRLWHPWQSVPPVQIQQLQQPVREILHMYAERRTHDGNGVTIKSQRRYIAYFWAVLCSSPGPVGSLPKPRTVQIRQVTISGLPAGTADSCVLMVEARPSGSLEPRGNRVCLRAAPRALGGGAAGLCMVPCAHAPLVQGDSCCISTDVQGDTLTFKMPAASLGLSTLPHSNSSSSSTAAHTAQGPGGLPAAHANADSWAGQGAPAHTPVAHTGTVSAAHGVPSTGASGCCVLCGAGSHSACACPSAAGVLPGSVPSFESLLSDTVAGPQASQAVHTCFDGCQGHQGQCHGAGGMGGGASSACADQVWSTESWEPSVEDGSCVVEGDVRLTVLRGTSRLFHTWFNTAFLPLSGTYTLTRAQLDKPSKGLPHGMSLIVRFVEMQPTADADDTPTAAVSAGHLPGQQHWQQQHSYSGLQDTTLDGEVVFALPQQAGSAPAQPGSRQQHSSQQQMQAGSMLAASLGPFGQQQFAEPASSFLLQPSAFEWLASGADADAKQPLGAVPVDSMHSSAIQQQQDAVLLTSAGGPVAPISSSAPASPQERKLRSSGSWRQHLPAISSISTSALLWGASADVSVQSIPQQQQQQKLRLPQHGTKRGSPGSWCGSAGLSWDWESLAAADDGFTDSAAPSALSFGGLVSGAQGVSSSWHSKGAGSGDAGAAAAATGLQQQQPQAWHSSWGYGKQQGGTHSSSTGSRVNSRGMQRLSQDLHSMAPGSSSSVRAGLVPALVASQASIELPVIVKRPSGIDSLVDALLDPEHSACSQTASTAAASAVSGKVLASEASSSAVSGHRPTSGVKSPSQLRKGYSWHGSTGWLLSKATGSKSMYTTNSSQPRYDQGKPQQQALDPHGTSGAWGDRYRGNWGDTLAAAEAATLDLDPLLSNRVSEDAIPCSALGSCSDPLQGLLEALNWSTDVQRYQTDHRQGRSRRTSSSSEPGSPRPRARGRLPNVLSSPLLQSCSSAPATPCEAQQAHKGTAAAAGAAASAEDTKPLVDGAAGSGRDRSAYGFTSGVSGAGLVYREGEQVGSSSGRRRRRGGRGDVRRLLDLQEWVEEETDGADTERVTGFSGQAHSGFCDQGLTVRDEISPAHAAVAAGSTAALPGNSSSRSRPTWPARRADSAPAGPSSTNPMSGPGPHANSATGKAASSASDAPAAAGGGLAGLRKSHTQSCPEDEGLLGLLAAEGAAAPSCAAEAPVVLKQWQQLEKAWQKSWWV